MKLKVTGILFAVASFVATAWGADVSEMQATYAACRWANSGAVLGAPLGEKVLETKVYTTDSGASLYAVRFENGVAFVSSDTEIEPVVAYTSNTAFEPSEDNPLWILLRRDTTVRHAMLQDTKAAASVSPMTFKSGPGAATLAAMADAQSRWSILLEGLETIDASDPRQVRAAVIPNMISGVSDVRRAALCRTQWSQTNAQGHYCYNLNTPNHDPSGCTATAMSQIMKYFAYPTASVEPKTFLCEVDNVKTELTMQGGVYEWTRMTSRPNASSYNERNWAEIGKLLSDTGITIQSNYTTPGTGSYVTRVPVALKKVFGYKNAVGYWNWSLAEEAAGGNGHVRSNRGLHKAEIREKVIFASLDAGSPVELGIYGYGDGKIGNNQYWEGHAVVGDGYGYAEYAGEKVAYVHINLGWHGLDDAWYNIPEIHSPNSGSYIGSKGTAFTVMCAAAWNIFPEETGNVLSGRATDDEGNGLAGAEISVYAEGDDTPIDTKITDEHGIYAFILPPNRKYDIRGSYNGNVAKLEGIFLRGDHEEVTDGYGTYTELDENIGNSWGNDLVMSDPTVLNVNTGYKYHSLDAALEEVNPGETLDILDDTKIRYPTEIMVNVTIRSNDPARMIDVRDGVKLTIASGVRALFDNTTFVNADNFITVRPGGVLAVRGAVSVGTVTTGDNKGIELAGAISRPITVRAPNVELGDAFGTFSCSREVAEETANNLLNAADEELGGVPSDRNTLVWGVVSVPEEAAAVKLEQNGETINFRSMRTLIKILNADAKITLIKDCTLEEEWVIDHIITLSGAAGEGVSLLANKGALIRVKETGSLTIGNLTVSDFKGRQFLVVEGGVVVLENGAHLTRLESTGVTTGAVVLQDGLFSMRTGSQITACKTAGYGAALFVGGGVFEMKGGRITGCSAVQGAGGVYAYTTDNQSRVLLSGNAMISGNTYGLTRKTSDLLVTDYDYPPEIAGAFSSGSRIGIAYVQTEKGNRADERFVKTAPGVRLSATQQTTALRTFVNDQVFGLSNKIIENYGTQEFYWYLPESTDEVPEGDTRAVIRVKYATGETHCYKTAISAFESITDDCELELLKKDVMLTDAVVVDYQVTLRTDPEVAELYYLERNDETASIKVTPNGELTLESVGVTGGTRAGENWNIAPGTRLFDVEGGALTLNAGAVVGFHEGRESRAHGAIVVWNGGEFTMNPGSRIERATNGYIDPAKDFLSGAGGAILLDGNAVGYLMGGCITGCSAMFGGAVSVSNGSVVHVGGDFSAADNMAVGGRPRNNNIVVEDLSTLYLEAPLAETCEIGRTAGYSADTNLVAIVEGWKTWDFDTLTNSAACFFKDERPIVRGFLVTNETTTAKIVWSTAIAADGSYRERDGKVYYAAGVVPYIEPEPEVETVDPDPVAFTSIRIDEEAQTVTLTFTNAVQWCNYSIFGVPSLVNGFAIDLLEALTNFQWTAEAKEVELTIPLNGNRFWKIKAESGEKIKE